MRSSSPISPSNLRKRIDSIDALRGLVILLMMLDHVRERFFYHMQVSDPMDLESTSSELFFTRFLAHFCAPSFVFLTGLSAWLYAHPSLQPFRSPREFLLKRGAFLIFLEIAVINFSWMGEYHTLWLQVIWAIGVSMIVLALVCHLPRYVIATLGLLIVAGHNLLTPIHFQPDEWGYSLWAILHDRGYIVTDGIFRVKASYPVLPWIGVITLGFSCGPLYSGKCATKRPFMLMLLAGGCALLFLVLRGFNLYGETLAWQEGELWIDTLKSLLNLTKYPPSLNFILVTFSGMFLALALLENRNNRLTSLLKTFGSVPMFVYIVHLYLLLLLHSLAVSVFGANYNNAFYSVPHLSWIWLGAVLLPCLLYPLVKWFAQFKHSRNYWWLKYL